MDPAKDAIGFIGIGVMGSSMAAHLMKAGYRIHAHTRTREKAKALLEAGAHWEESPAQLAPKCRVIFTMVGYPSDVEAVYFGPKGLIENAMPGTILVDCSTSKPELAVHIASSAKTRGLAALDAPVSGGDIGAKNAKLTIMVGGARADFDEVEALFRLMGEVVVLQGGQAPASTPRWPTR